MAVPLQSKEVQCAIMDCILDELEKAKGEQILSCEIGTTERKLSYGLSKRILEKHRLANPWLNRDILNNYKRRKERLNRPVASINIASLTDNVSDLTNAESQNVAVLTAVENTTTDIPIKNPGRPKGSTKESKRSDIRRLQLALNHAATESLSIKEEAYKNANSRAPKGAYKQIVNQAEKDFNLPAGSINMDTVLARLKPGRKIVTAGRGNVSPLIAIEAHFLDVIIQLAAMRQPLTCFGALNLINSMISSSNLSDYVIEWKEKHKISGEDKHRLGMKYWHNFKKRHPEINTKRAVRFDSKRDDWCSYENFEKMYSRVYSAMVRSNVAIELPEKVMVTLDGRVTDKKEESYGRETTFLLTHPEYIFFVDEVGCNTSQKSDGNVGGQKFVVQSNKRALIRASHQDCHFTILGFTNGLGEPVCCVIILAAPEVRAKDIMGLQPWASIIGDPSIDFEENSHGPEKFYPYGPTCTVFGRSIPTLVRCSESGSITSNILMDTLKHIDKCLELDRSEVTPFLLLDGHGSRFELPFLDYVNSDETKWTVCIGMPYGTNLWQVGDSAQQNGAYKSRLTLEKQLLLEKKQELRLDFRIDRHDVVGLVHRSWEYSFARKESNKKAISERGWNPLTYNLLDHPELKKEKDSFAIKNAYQLASINGKENIDPSCLNFDDGVAKTMMDKIVEQKIRDRALEQAREEQREDIMARRLETFNRCLRMTAGVAFNAGTVELTDGRVHQRVIDQTRIREQNEIDAAERRRQQLENTKSKVDAIRSKSTDPTKWNANELNTMVSWFKRPGDSNIPKRKEQLLQRYMLTCHRREDEPKRKKDDEPPAVDDNPANTVNDPEDATANETVLEANEGVAAALLVQIAMTEV